MAAATPDGKGSDAKDGSGIEGQPSVGGDQGEALDHCLGQQQPIERITVYLGQHLNLKGVRRPDREFIVASIQKVAAQDTGLHDEIRTVQTALDRDFPQAGHTERQVR